MEEELLSALYKDAVWAGVALYLEALYILRYFLHHTSSKSHSVHGVWPRNVELKWFPKLQFKMEERELAAQLLR